MAQSETTQTEVGHEGGGHSNFPPFDASTFPAQILWFFIAFGLLYWFMSKRALPQIGAVIENRKARIARDLDDATAMQQKADAAAAAHEKTLAEARAKAQSMAQAARDQLAAQSDAKRKTLEDELAARLAEAERQIAADPRAGDDQRVGDRARGSGGYRRAARGPPGRPRVRRGGRRFRQARNRRRMMEIDAEFFVLLGFLVFVGVLIYFGVHRMVLKGLDARGEAIQAELDQASRLRAEATALLASFEKKTAEAEANAAAIVAEARAQAEQLAKDAAERMNEFIARRTKQAEAKIAFAEAQAAADVRAAAADHAAKAAEVVLKDQMQGSGGADLVAREIAGIKTRLN